jgi:hypothetical protein
MAEAMMPRTFRTSVNKTSEGVMVPIFNEVLQSFDGFHVGMSYISTIAPMTSKGPILHTKRRSIVMSMNTGVILEFIDGDTSGVISQPLFDELGPILVEVMPNQPCLFKNTTNDIATLIVHGNYAWQPNDDESQKFDGWDAFRKFHA